MDAADLRMRQTPGKLDALTGIEQGSECQKAHTTKWPGLTVNGVGIYWFWQMLLQLSSRLYKMPYEHGAFSSIYPPCGGG